MKKNFITFLILIFLTGCSAPGSALLGPVFTGATSKSLAQATLSFGTNTVIRNIHEASKKSKTEIRKIVRKIEQYKVYPQNKDLLRFHK